jgi:PEP-CTERM motif
MIRALACAVLCLLLYTSAKADTFTLLSGSANTGFAEFSLSGSGPNIVIQGGAGLCTTPEDCQAVFVPESFAFATCNPSPCAPGSTLNVGGVFLASNLNIGNNFGGVATINGVTFFGVNFSGALNFTGSILLPADYVMGQPVNVPFSMEGQLTGIIRCVGMPFPCTQQVFDISLNGSGIATFSESEQPGVTYNFQPVPEPATLGLFAVSLLAVARIYRARPKSG